MLGTRRAASKICAEALALGCDVIVMGADPARNRFLGDLMWSQEPQRVKRRAKVAVYLVHRLDAGALPTSRATVQPSELDGQLEREEIVLVETQAGQLSIRPRRWRRVLGWMYRARALSITERRSDR